AYFCRLAGIPYVVEPMGMFRPIVQSIRLKRLYHQLLGIKLLSGAGVLVATSDQEKQELVQDGVPEGRVIIRRNGVTLPAVLPERGTFRRERGIPPEASVVLFLGRIVPKKSPNLLLRAFAGLALNGTQRSTLLVIAGPFEGDAYRQELESLVQQLGLSNRVIFTGPLYDDAKWSAYRD